MDDLGLQRVTYQIMTCYLPNYDVNKIRCMSYNVVRRKISPEHSQLNRTSIHLILFSPLSVRTDKGGRIPFRAMTYLVLCQYAPLKVKSRGLYLPAWQPDNEIKQRRNFSEKHFPGMEACGCGQGWETMIGQWPRRSEGKPTQCMLPGWGTMMVKYITL